MTDLAVQPIEAVASLLERGEASPVELVSSVLEAIDRLEPNLRSYVSVFSDRAMDDAEFATEEIRSGRYIGPLHGVPISIKDNIAVGGWPTTNGSSLWAEHTTDFDAAVVERLRSSGAIIIGKSNMHEWGMGGTCIGMHFGTVRNPWDLDRIPGGSSGGSAAGVSAGLATASIGADGWGSIRTPASYCGVVGLMPTQGLVSRYGELPPTSSWHHTVGPITKTVRDSAIVFDAIRGFDRRDPTSTQPNHEQPTLAQIDDGVTGVKIGVPRSYFFDDATPPVHAAIDAAAAIFGNLGATIEEVDLPSLAQVPLALAASQHEAQSVLLPLALQHLDGFASPAVRNRILAGEFVRDADRRRGMQVRNKIRWEIRELFTRVDIVLSPCNATVAFPIEATHVAVGSAQESVDLGSLFGQSRLTTRLTLPWNLSGVPAISLPSGNYSEGMPIGLQLAAGPQQESTLLAVAFAYEVAAGGYKVPPFVDRAVSEGAP